MPAKLKAFPPSDRAEHAVGLYDRNLIPINNKGNKEIPRDYAITNTATAT